MKAIPLITIAKALGGKMKTAKMAGRRDLSRAQSTVLIDGKPYSPQAIDGDFETVWNEYHKVTGEKK